MLIYGYIVEALGGIVCCMCTYREDYGTDEPVTFDGWTCRRCGVEVD